MLPISPCYPRIGTLTSTWRGYVQKPWRSFGQPISLFGLAAAQADVQAPLKWPISPCYPRIGGLTGTWRGYTQTWRSFGQPFSLFGLLAAAAEARKAAAMPMQAVVIGTLGAGSIAGMAAWRQILPCAATLLVTCGQAEVEGPFRSRMAAASRSSRSRMSWRIS